MKLKEGGGSLVEKLGTNTVIELEEIAQRVIGERKIESIVRLDETAIHQ